MVLQRPCSHCASYLPWGVSAGFALLFEVPHLCSSVLTSKEEKMVKGRRKTYLSMNKPFLVPRTTLFNRRQQARSSSASGLPPSDLAGPSNAPPSSFVHADTYVSEPEEQGAFDNTDDAYVRKEKAGLLSDSFSDTSSASVGATGEDGGGGPPSSFELPFMECARRSGERTDSDNDSLASHSDSYDSSYEREADDVDTPLLCFEDSEGEEGFSIPTTEDGAFSARDPDSEEGAHIPFAESTLPGSPTTVATAVVLITAFVVAHGLSWTGLDDLLRLINVLFGSTVLPHTKYLFRKLWAQTKQDRVVYHYYCDSCSTLLNPTLTCEVCNTVHKLAELRLKGSFFVILKIRDQLSHLVHMNKRVLHENLLKLQTATSDYITDITSGAAYQRLKRDGILKEGDLTVTFNTDGSPLFKSSKTSIWPIQLTLNELPPEVRLKSSTLAGLWFGKKHPNMSIFLSKFGEQFESMEPLAWSCDTTTYVSRAYAICCCVDAPARAAVQNYMQFNSFFGCPWCLSPATNVERELSPQTFPLHSFILMRLDF